MRLTVAQPWLVILMAIGLVSPSLRFAYAAEVELPKIATSCKLVSSAALPVLPLRFPPSAVRVMPEQVAQVKKIQGLIQSKRWEPALQEFQQGSAWVQDETLRSLLAAMVQAKEGMSATQFVLEQFSPLSQNRAEGIGTIAAELIRQNQLAAAIDRLKHLPQQSNYLSDAIIPMVEALTAMNQIDQIAGVMALFPIANEKWSVWTDVAREVAFEPAQARVVAGMVKDAYLRSMVRSHMANRWVKNRNGRNAWAIANDIEDCGQRADTFLAILQALKTADLPLSNRQTAQALEQLEALIAAIPNPENTFPNPIHLRLALSRLNIQNRRNAQGVRLLERIAQDLQPSDPATFRAVTLFEIASQYQAMSNRRVAVQMLDAAVAAIRAAYRVQPSAPGQLPWVTPSDQWGEAQLTEVARMYRSLNQIQKAAAIEETLPQRAKITIPPRLVLPSYQRSAPAPRSWPTPPAPVPSLNVPQDR